MPRTQPGPELGEPKSRMRRSHRKSRYGCANCKIRRVKCDESKPRCLKCVSFGVGCSYEPGVSEMQLDVFGSFRVDMSPSAHSPASLPLPRSLPDLPTYLPLVGTSGELYQVTSFHRNLLKKFRESVVLTVGPKDAALVFQAHALEFSIKSPFLTHLILAIALLYDMHTTGRQDKQETAALAFHFYHGVSLFNAKLSQPVEHSEKDALWAAAALTGASAFADVKDTDPAGAWPLTSYETADLDWLKMTGGKRAVYNITNPIRPGSVFNASCDHFLDPSARIGREVLNLPSKFIQICNLDESSTPRSNPYHGAATILAQVMPLDCDRKNIHKFLSFVGFPDPRFLRLLEQRDPPAMLLLAYWYAKILAPEHWWIWRRAIAEGPALCTFLEGVFSGDPQLLELLEFPKATFAAAARRSNRAVPY
ncbi:hypothetical protein QBC34DRAFT_304916 [Podospora aff. communis PSN243]|uniref:Zn(2)-C6 fungal-type domain-containing protein n=1 Tax=Podospora aff. communis PSN243 TaxID=3040156 RepID=A0AAV9GGN3_9PEZI|nr:hypothetical protein QBC34DRAFT_304916 [Podospora aff. communis PSN243]